VAPRLAPLMRAVQVFGFHLATLDLRQSSDKHEAVVAELLRVARIEPDYAALTRRRAATLLLRLLPTRARCACAAPPTRELARAELASSRPRARRSQRYGREAIRHYIISHTEEVSDLLEVLLLQQGMRA
jgi:phosphoenolpyruvate carboxylase